MGRQRKFTPWLAGITFFIAGALVLVALALATRSFGKNHAVPVHP